MYTFSALQSRLNVCLQNAVLLHKLHGHRDSVWCASMSGNCRRIATGSFDKTVKVWSTDTGNLICTLHGHKDLVLCVDMSNDAKLVASGGGALTDEDDSNERALRSVKLARSVISHDTTVRIWSLHDEESPIEWKKLVGHTGLVRAVRFSPDEKKLTSAGEDKKVIV